MKKILRFVFVCIIFLNCTSDEQAVEYTYVDALDFENEITDDLRVADGLQVDLWAPGPLLRNAVSLTFDNQGVAYVTETERRQSSDLDIRAHPLWMTESLGLSSLEETHHFHRTVLDPDLSNQNTWLKDFDQNGLHDYRDLMVQSERVRRIEDTDGDGKADRSSIFAEAFQDMLTGVAAGILVQDGAVYVSIAPDLWKLVDHDNDGLMDDMQSISHGYGIHIAYAGHDMSGITMGPDGRLYWSIGDMGVNTVDQDGKQWYYPHEGAIMRCNPDGSDFEIYAHGLRNPQELAFNKYGDLFTVDNDGDHPGEHERYIHVLEGSDAGWRIHWQYGKYNLPYESYKVWTEDRLHKPYFEGQAAYIVPPIAEAPNGPCGLVYNPGFGWGETWRDAFIASYFTGSSANSKVEAFWMEPNGSSYQLDKTQEVITGIVPTGIEFSPSGELFLADWKDSYSKKPAGRIWKVNTSNSSLLVEQGKIYSILKSNWKSMDLNELVQLLSHSDMRVRMKAQFELVRRNASDTFEQVIEKGGEEIPIIHAIWGLGQLGRTQNYDCGKLILPLKEDRPEIRAQAAKVLGENKTKEALDDLIICLQDPSIRVVRNAVEAIGKVGDTSAFEPLIYFLEEHNKLDPYLRHTFALAISRMDYVEQQCAELSEHPSAQVRMIGVLTLRHLSSKIISRYLKDADLYILNEVARAIHDDESIPEALGALAVSLNESLSANEVFLRRAINANLRLGQDDGFNRLHGYAMNPKNENSMRKEAILAMSYWNDPPLLDRVEGRYRKVDNRRKIDARIQLSELLNNTTIKSNSALWSLSIRAVGELRVSSLEDELFEISTEENLHSQVYIAMLQSLEKISSVRLGESVLNVLHISDQQLQSKILDLLQSEVLTESFKNKILVKMMLSEEMKVKQSAILAMPTISSGRDFLIEKMERLVEDKLMDELALETLEAASQSQNDRLKMLLDSYYEQLDTSILMNKYGPALYGGSSEKGFELFHKNPSMTCTQCHTLDKIGGLAGPDLSDIGSQLSRVELLESLINPGKRIAPGYGSVMIKKKDGNQISGMLLEESDSQVIIQAEKAENVIIPNSSIQEITKSPSAMVSVEGYLSIREIRDLIAFLTSLQG